MKLKVVIISIPLILLIVFSVYCVMRFDKAFLNSRESYPSTPKKVIIAYLKAHGDGDREAVEMFLSEKQKEILSKPNVLRATEPIYKTLLIKTIKEEMNGKENFQEYRDNEHVKVYWVEWYAELTEYGKRNYSRPSGNMSWYFFLIKDSNGKWKIDSWGY